MDVIHLVEIGNGDHLKAVPLPRYVSVGHQEKPSTSDQVSSYLSLILLFNHAFGFVAL